MSIVSFKTIEEKLPDNLDWLPNRIILLTETGSFAYGTNVEGSDIDTKGICIPPEDYYLGLKSINEFNNTGGKNFTKNDIDVAIMHINKFVRDAMQGVPNNLDILFVEEDNIIQANEFGRELINMRKEFLSQSIIAKFFGYATSQKHKIEVKKDNKTGRQDLILKHGYDTKFAMHAIRLLTSALEILETCDYHTKRPNKDFLLDIRNGKYTMEEIFDMIDDFENKIREAEKTTKLRKTCDFNRINKWLIDLNRRALDYDWKQNIDKI